MVAASDEGDKYREPIPESSAVALSMPHGESAGAPSASSSPQAMGGGTPYAKYYQLTRDIADGVDWTTAAVLGRVWLLVHTRPTSVQGNRAVWGPGQESPLSPVVWEFSVVETSPGVFDYALRGRPKASNSDADFVSVLTGHGYGKAHPHHREGSFSFDNDAQRRLDPQRGKDTGKVDVAYDLIAFPTHVDAKIQKSGADFTDILVSHEANKAGSVDLSAHVDIEDVPDGNLEDIVLHSRWAPDGAGRADVQIAAGDLPAVVKASECWSTAFLPTYYTDSASFRPTSGSSDRCVFP